MPGPTSYLRLLGAGWRLLRADALAPREIDPLLTPSQRTLARGLRLVAGPRARAGRPGERLASALETMGPVAIKLGQFLSTRADILGTQFADDLSRLKDRLAPFPTPLAVQEVETALGAPVSRLFATFGEVVGAASLAQVHAATLPDGRKVAVKILRPGVEAMVAADVRSLILAGDLAARLVPGSARLEPRAFVATVARTLQLELDLRFEAAGADELRVAMDEDGFMRAPKVVWDRTARRVLTLEWAGGEALSSPGALERSHVDRPRLAADLVRGFLAQALDHGVFHADLHEGNLFIDEGGRLVAVDFGIIGRLGPPERRYLAEILWGFLERDYVRVAEVHFVAGYVPAHHDRAAFAQALRAVGEPIFGRAAADVAMSRLLTQLFDITALFDMRLRPELVLLQKTMVTVEGVGRRPGAGHLDRRRARGAPLDHPRAFPRQAIARPGGRRAPRGRSVRRATSGAAHAQRRARSRPPRRMELRRRRTGGRVSVRGGPTDALAASEAPVRPSALLAAALGAAALFPLGFPLLLQGPIGLAVPGFEHGPGRPVARDDREDIGLGIVEQLVAIGPVQGLDVAGRVVDEVVDVGDVFALALGREVAAVLAELVLRILFRRVPGVRRPHRLAVDLRDRRIAGIGRAGRRARPGAGVGRVGQALAKGRRVGRHCGRLAIAGGQGEGGDHRAPRKPRESHSHLLRAHRGHKPHRNKERTIAWLCRVDSSV
jgi:ubiquinone biosynthesis protein